MSRAGLQFLKCSQSFETALAWVGVTGTIPVFLFHLTEGSGVQIVQQRLIADLCAKYSAAPLNVNYVWQAGS